MHLQLSLSLPQWIKPLVSSHPNSFKTVEDKMRLVLELAKNNVIHKTGGPFAAAVFNLDTGELVAVGVNRVMCENCFGAHAEMMALMLAQKALNTFDLSLKGNFQLVTSAKMCIMCLGGVIWSGVKEVVYSADTHDVQSIVGFDEGPVPKEYKQELVKRGVNVISNVLQKEGQEVLKLYRDSGGFVYNSQNNPLKDSIS